MEKKFENPVFVTSLPKYDHSTAVIHLLKLILLTVCIDFCDINMPMSTGWFYYTFCRKMCITKQHRATMLGR